jgi:hypothetical protein
MRRQHQIFRGRPSDSPVPPSGRQTDVRHVHRFKVRAGRIVEHWAVRNDLCAMLEAGVVAPPRR